ncbi:MAG: hypothetical protein RL169_1241, partial [Armatimonadota bacterium]
DDGIRDGSKSRGLGDVYKRQPQEALSFCLNENGLNTPDIPATAIVFATTREQI